MPVTVQKGLTIRYMTVTVATLTTTYEPKHFCYVSMGNLVSMSVDIYICTFDGECVYV